MNGQKLSAYGVSSNDISYVIDNKGTLDDLTDDQQYARFTVPMNSVSADGDVAFHVEGVANTNGATMTPVDTKISLLDNTQPTVLPSQAVVTGQRQIVLTYNEPIQYKAGADKISAAKNFVVTAGGSQLTVLEAVVDSTATGRTVTLNLGSDIPLTGSVSVKVQKDVNGSVLVEDQSTNINSIKEEVITVR